MASSGTKNNLVLAILVLITLTSIMILSKLDAGIIGYVTYENGTNFSLEPVINLTFDDESDPWKDYSYLNHEFTEVGSVSWADSDVCKWYGCLDLTASGNNYIQSLTNWSSMADGGFAVEWWAYHNQRPSGSIRPGYYWIGTDGISMKSAYEDNQGFTYIIHNISSDKLSQILGYADPATEQIWHHYFVLYNKTHIQFYRDGALRKEEATGTGPVGYNISEILKIGTGRYGESFDGYMDEFLFFNHSNFNSTYASEQYNLKREGTPATLDLFVENIKYTLPFDWSDDRNQIINGGTMDINVTIKNAGIQDSTSFVWKLEIENNIICQNTAQVNALSEITITCPWTTKSGFHTGLVYIDTLNSQNEDIEINNEQKIYIPFLSRPWFHFNFSEWDNTLYPYMTDSNNQVAFDDYTWSTYGGCSDFNQGYDGNNIDPYGKYSRTCAMSCLINNYSGYGCSQARIHLFGWANRSTNSYNNVQNIHELAHLGMAYDVMFPTLTKEENDLISGQLVAICQQITNLDSIRPDQDDDDLIVGDNGQGFGAGMGGFCYSLLGANIDNPTLIHELPQQYWGTNVVDEWMDRELRYLRSYKNDSWALYEEALSYKFYSQYHPIENWYFEKRYDLIDSDIYQNAFCSMAREALTQTLDFNYNGQSLRNDKNQYQRLIQRGDSYSYAHPSDGSILNRAVYTYYGLLCDDINTKKGILWLRNKANEVGDGDIVDGFADAYLYGLLYDEVGEIPTTVTGLIPNITFDNANDIFTIRDGYSYVNDTVIQIDGGEERMNGHSTASGYYIYALGEPFLDYTQVPYEDDVRAETWTNGISLQDDPQTSEGDLSFYNSNCYSAELNQYYGMSDCPKASYSDDYPDFRILPLEYGGDLEDYIGTNDAEFSGVYVWRPYANANPVKEYFVKYGDILVKRTKVTSVTEGDGIYHNFININDEFSETRQGTNFTLSRQNKNLDVNIIYSDQTFTLNGGESNLQYCFGKTDCSGSYRGLGKYRRLYLHTDATEADFILGHHWYYDGQEKNQVPIGSTDKGVKIDGKNVVFDTNNDGIININGRTTDGWAFAFNDELNEIGSFNASVVNIGYNVFESENPISIFIKNTGSKLILTVNTMQRVTGIDYPQTIAITIDGRDLTNNSGFTVKKDNIAIPIISQSQTKVTFEVESGQNSQEYIITGLSQGDAPPSVSASAPIPNKQFYTESSYVVSFSCLGTDDNLIDSIVIESNKTGSMSTLQATYPNSAGGVLSFSSTFDQGIYAWRCIVTDNASQSTSSSTYLFSVSPTPVVLPDISEFDGRTTDFSSLSSLDNQSGIVLENTNEAFLNFTGTISTLNGVNLSDSVEIEPTYISVDSSTYPQLNVPACLEFYNVSFTTPRIKKDGSVYSSYTNLSYVNGTLSFCVSGFSTYLIEETPTSPPVEEDSGSSGGGGGGGGGGGSGGGGFGSFSSPSTDENTSDEAVSDEVQIFENEEGNTSTSQVDQEVEAAALEEPTQDVQPEFEEPSQTSSSLFDEVRGTSVLVGAVILFAIIFISIGIIKKHKRSHTQELLERYKFK